MTTEEGKTTNPEEKKADLGDGITRHDYDEAIRKARLYQGQVHDYEQKYNSYKGLGDLDDIKVKLNKLDELERKSVGNNPEALEEWQKSTEQKIRESVQAELVAARERAEKVTSQLHELEVVDKVSSEWGNKFLPSAMQLIKNAYIKPFVAKDDQGFYIKDEKGEIRFNGALRMSLEDYQKEIAARHEDLLAGQRATGTQPRGETKPSGQAQKSAPNVEGLTQEEMVKAFREAGRANTWNN